MYHCRVPCSKMYVSFPHLFFPCHFTPLWMKVAVFEKSKTSVYGRSHCAASKLYPVSDLNLQVLCMVFFNNNFGLLAIAVFMWHGLWTGTTTHPLFISKLHCLRSSLLWDFIQCGLVVSYVRFRRTYRLVPYSRGGRAGSPVLLDPCRWHHP